MMKNKEIKSLFKERFDSYVLPEKKNIRAFKMQNTVKTAEYVKKSKARFNAKRILAVAVAAVLSVCLLCTAVYAAVPEFRAFINIKILYPEASAIEIYTLDQLDAVRNDRSANYRLMADIAIPPEEYEKGGRFEGGFTPIGSFEEPFVGIFDGNGHTIYGLKVAKAENMGLFGAVVGGLTSYTANCRGVVMNLRLKDGSIEVSGAPDEISTAGAICGLANYVANCSVESFEIKVNGAKAVGGIAGDANIIDNCYSDVTVSADSSYCGSFAGRARAIVTSYAVSEGEMCGMYASVPTIISETQFNSFKELVASKTPSAKRDRDMKIFEAFFMLCDISELSASQKTALNRYYNEYSIDKYTELSGKCYVIEPSLDLDEELRLETILQSKCTKEEVAEYLFDENAKRGNVYSINGNVNDIPEGFDSDIWEMSNGKLRLSAFE